MLDAAVELAWDHVFGIRPRVLGYAEREAFAAAVLLARMEEQSLEPAPIFCGDFRGLDARPLRGRCCILAAGLPCQPYSSAGKQRGLKDARSWGGGDGPLPHALRIIGECAPAVVCFENVPQWVTQGAFRQFGDALSALGYEIEDPLFVRASDVGASHRRERVFILAHRASERINRQVAAGSRNARSRAADPERESLPVAHGEEQCRNGGRCEQEGRRSDIADVSQGMADAERGGLREQRLSRLPGDTDASGEGMADAGGAGWSGGGEYPGGLEQADGSTVWRSTAEFCDSLFAPGPKCATWARTLRKSPYLAPAVEPGLRLLVDGMAVALDASRADQLRCGGNGVVVAQAAAAFVHLFKQLT